MTEPDLTPPSAEPAVAMSASDSFTALDWIGVGLNAVAAAVLFAFPFVVAPKFASMFTDFGAKSALPAITRAAMTPWPGLALGLMVSTLTAMVGVLRGPDTIAVRRGLVAALNGTASNTAPVRSAERKRILELERELRRKDKALAEAAALLILEKVRAIWGDGDDDTDTRSAG